MLFLRNFLLLIFTVLSVVAHAQEYVVPLQENVEINKRSRIADQTAQKPTVLTLPFFEDFTDYDPYPNQERWMDRYVYINNTFGRNPVSRGVATFDALNEHGAAYYDTIGNYTQIYADSLTSREIDLSSYQPSDSVYLSFFYQRKGYGFSPKPGDSLMLFLSSEEGVWQQVWAMQGDTGVAPFQQVMIPIVDTNYFYDKFQVMWLNKATIGISNSHWNLDYIRIDAGRNRNDTALRDVAFTTDPKPILSDFTSMPFRHFKTNPNSFLDATVSSAIRNNGPGTLNIQTGYRAMVPATGTTLGTGSSSSAVVNNVNTPVSFPMYNAGTYNPPNPNGLVDFENTFYCSSGYPGESLINDTIVSHQIFDNYFAYDDGTAEQAYFLNLQSNAPGITAIEYALYMPDTLRGVAIRFARTLPGSEQKEFAIGVYSDITPTGSVLLYQESYLYPSFVDTINRFSIYTFSQPLHLNSGIFYVGIIQPAGGTSDSLQIALDANRTGANHRYFKVLNTWEPSLLDGALLVRPIVGSASLLGISEQSKPKLDWTLSPNPAYDEVRLNLPQEANKKTAFTIYDIQGKALLRGITGSNPTIDVSSLSPGMYIIDLKSEDGYYKPQKLLKW